MTSGATRWLALALLGTACAASADDPPSAREAPPAAPSPVTPAKPEAEPSALPVVDTGPCSLGLPLPEADCDRVRAMRRPAKPPASPTNAHADDEGAAKLGFAIFFDARFSANGKLRCATCHQPEKWFAEAQPVSTGLELTTRNAPTAIDAAFLRWMFWDGRADSVWSQPLFAFEGKTEMGFTRLAIAHRIRKSYAESYEAVFGPLPELTDAARFPATGAPGDASWEGMSPADRDAIDRVAANVGKALEAYERRLVSTESKLDRFAGGDASALNEAEQRGLALFASRGCATCHGGPMLTDGDFHALLPTTEAGRAGAMGVLQASPFTAAGPFSDGAAPADYPPAPRPSDAGAFRTPPLRNVARTAPYGHDGRWPTLKDAIASHPSASGMSAAEIADVVTFLGAASGGPPPLPWGNWPNG